MPPCRCLSRSLVALAVELVHRWDTPLVNLAVAEMGSVPGTGRDADTGTSGPLRGRSPGEFSLLAAARRRAAEKRDERAPIHSGHGDFSPLAPLRAPPSLYRTLSLPPEERQVLGHT